MTQETEVRFNAALKNLDALTPEVLQNPANKDWVEELKKHALSNDFIGTVQFVNMGDPDVIESCMKEFRADDIRRWRITNLLMMCSQPKVIVVIGEELNWNESPKPKRDDDMRIYPASVEATWIIGGIIQNSPAFDENVKRWVKKWEYYDEDNGIKRTIMRMWWAENKELLKAERYAEVKPPSGRQPDLPGPTPEERVSSNPSLSPTQSPTPTATPTPTALQPSSTKTYLLPATIGSIALLIGIVAYLFRSKA
jgi:hypothetical protein